MSRGNPQKAMAALLPLTVRVECEGGSYEVRPMTLGMWAALERIHSPIVTGIEPKDTLEIIPSLYLLTHDPREVFRGNILELSMEWADRQPVGAVAAIKAAGDSQMAAVTDVIPEATQKKESDGWIAAIVHWAAEKYHWRLEEILWEVPLSAIALLRRQEWIKDDRVFPLSVIEEIDNGN